MNLDTNLLDISIGDLSSCTGLLLIVQLKIVLSTSSVGDTSTEQVRVMFVLAGIEDSGLIPMRIGNIRLGWS